MNPVAEKQQTNEFNVSVNMPLKPAGIVKMPEQKKSFFSRAGGWLGVEAVHTPQTPTEEKPQDFSIADTATPIDASKPLGVPAGVSNGIEQPSVPQAFQDATQNIQLDPAKPVFSAEPSGSGVSAVPSEEQKFTLDPNAIKPVNSTGATPEAVSPASAPQPEVPQVFQEATQGINLDPTVAAPAVAAPVVSEVPKAFEEGLKDVNLDPTIPASSPEVPKTFNDGLKDVNLDPTVPASSPEVPKTFNDGLKDVNLDPTVPVLEHPAIPAPSSLDSSANTENNMGVAVQADKKTESELGKSETGSDDVSKEEPLLFAEQGAVEEGVLPGADGALAPEMSETEKKEQGEKLEITGKAIDALEAQNSKTDDNSRWVVDVAPSVAAVSQEKPAMSEEEKKRDSEIKSLLIGSNPSRYMQVKEGKLIVDKQLLEADKKNYLLILADGDPDFRKQLEECGVQYEHLQAVMKNELREEAAVS